MTNELFALYMLLIVLALLASLRPGRTQTDKQIDQGPFPAGSEPPFPSERR